ncbi:TetR family transcriptional regulator [Gracilibacillus timonensis]|uniref:TetR family transcriptional regulator n=1 Tax=Gracilibacillus timonensis TaxID=1816696 RepID=UPI00082620FB|nr:TetR family transcriptional regulator [Gracilibacillus timonensis]
MAPKVSAEYKRERKKELVEIAKQVFIEQGFIHTSMQDIMNKAGISRGALYSYFDNVEHVFLEVLRDDDETNIPDFVSAKETSIWLQIKNWLDEQRLYVESIHQTLLQARAEFFLSSHYVKDKDNSPYISVRYNRLIETIADILNEGKRTGELNPQQPTQSIARYLVSFLNGLMLDTFQLGYDQTKIKEQLDVLLFTLEQLVHPKSIHEE